MLTEDRIAELTAKAAGRGMQEPVPAYIVINDDGSNPAEDEIGRLGYVYARLRSFDNPEYTLVVITPGQRSYLANNFPVWVMLSADGQWYITGPSPVEARDALNGYEPPQTITPHGHTDPSDGGPLDAEAIASGTFDDARLSSNVVLLLAAQTLANKVLTSPVVNTPDVNGGTIDDAVIGATTPAAATVLALSATTLNTSGAVVHNEAGADVDFRIEGDTDANLVTVDAGLDALGIGTTPHASAKFHVASSVKGSIPAPVMSTASRVAIASPAKGLSAYDSDENALYIYDGTTWQKVEGGSSVDASVVTYTPAAPSKWPDPDPDDAAEALDSLADQVDALTGLVGGGAPDNANYITGVSSAGLTNETVIPGLRASADIAGAAGGGITEEYDTSSTGLSWSPSSPATEDSNSTILSHLYVRSTDTTERFGLRSWSPSGAFDARCKMEVANEFEATLTDGGGALMVADGGNTNRLMLTFNRFNGSKSFNVSAYTYTSSTYTQRGATWSVGGNVAYLRITRDGSNNCSFWWSSTGNLWQLIFTVSFTFTVAQVGYRISSTTANYSMASDWLRTDV